MALEKKSSKENKQNLLEINLRKERNKRRKAEKKLREIERQYRLVFDYAPYGLMRINKEGVIVEANVQVAKIFGLRISECLGKHFSIFNYLMPKKTFSFISKRFKKRMKGEQTISLYGLQMRDVKGNILDLEINVKVIKEGKRIKGELVVIRDITEQKRIERELKESEERFRTFIETASDLMHIADENGDFIYVNQAMAKALGYTKKEMIGMHITNILSPEVLEKRFKNNLKKLIKKGEINIETVWVTKRGRKIYVEGKVVAVYDNKGNFMGSRAIFRDVTKRKRTEEKIKKFYKALEEKTETLEETKASLEIKVRARTKELRELAESLERQVKERTRELQERVEELAKTKAELELKIREMERFHKMTMGREERILELKKRIKELESKLKRAHIKEEY